MKMRANFKFYLENPSASPAQSIHPNPVAATIVAA